MFFIVKWNDICAYLIISKLNTTVANKQEEVWKIIEKQAQALGRFDILLYFHSMSLYFLISPRFNRA